MNDNVRTLSRAIPQWMARERVPGLAVAVVEDGEITWTEGFGVLCAGSPESVTSTSIFEAASLSKQVFAYSVLKLCEAGRLEMDRPLRAYLDRDYIEDARANEITARHVLSHTTGFPNWRGDNALRTHFAPGSQYSYSGEGFVYLQHVVDALVDAPVHNHIATELMAPLGMEDASFIWPGNGDPPVARPHDEEGKAKPKVSMPQMNAAFSLHCSVLDYARFLNFVLTQPDHAVRLPDTLHREMFTPQIPVNDSISGQQDWPRKTPHIHDSVFWGLGWGLCRDEQRLSAWQWGSNAHMRTFVIGFPEERTGAVFMGNGCNAARLWDELIDTLFGVTFAPIQWVKESFGL